ncbi:Spx domain-containing protein 1, partial [Globisporangium splendens]
MKFGKVLQQSMQMSSSSWEPHWVDYKQLKHIIKDCAHIQKEEKLQGDKLVKTKIKPSAKEDNDSIRKSPDEMNFFRTLRVEIKKIADFFVQEQAKHTNQVAAIEQISIELKTSLKPETKTELMKSCVSLYKELLLLENFAVMNFCGISKILKKHDKWTGYATRHKFMHTILMKQPFATYVPLLQMIDRLEHIFMEATGSSIDQHDAQKAGRRGSGGSGAGSSGSFFPNGNNGGGSRTNSPRSSSHQNHTPGNSPPSGGTGPGAGTYGEYSSGGDQQTRDLSPRSEDSVPLVKVHALRGDAWQLKQMESVGDYDGDEEDDGEDDGNDDGTFQDEFAASPPREVEAKSASVAIPDVQPQARLQSVSSLGHHSDSDAAAIAMLSMKESLARNSKDRIRGSGVSSDGGESSGPDGRGRFNKRKAFAPLTSAGKRKMSFATILN